MYQNVYELGEIIPISILVNSCTIAALLYVLRTIRRLHRYYNISLVSNNNRAKDV